MEHLPTALLLTGLTCIAAYAAYHIGFRLGRLIPPSKESPDVYGPKEYRKLHQQGDALAIAQRALCNIRGYSTYNPAITAEIAITQMADALSDE